LDSLDDGVQSLVRLGLTSCEVRVYFALARSGYSTVKTISKASKIPREYVYKIMPNLQERGLVEKVVAKPATFRAVPIKDALSILFEYRSRETFELQQKTRELVNNFKQTKNLGGEEMPQFVVVPSKEAAFKRKRMIIDAETGVDMIVSGRHFLAALSSYGEVVLKRLENGVRFRVITEKLEDENRLPKVWQNLEGSPPFGLRYVPMSPRALMTVYDSKEVLFSVSTLSALEDVCLWSNNPCLLAIVQDYFEIMWITAMETPHYSTDGEQA